MNAHFKSEYVKNLPDAYSKALGSNNARLLDIAKGSVDTLRETISAVYDSLDIDKATGKSLDMFGDMVGQARGAATDEQYRAMIKSKIARNLSNADFNSVIHAICAVFGCDPTDILLTESDKPCVATMEKLPYGSLISSNIDQRTAIKIIAGLLPAGVRLESVVFAGTLEFAATSDVYDSDAGFGDIDQTIGGYFGFVSDTDGSNLPI